VYSFFICFVCVGCFRFAPHTGAHYFFLPLMSSFSLDFVVNLAPQTSLQHL
jgi:hypothetical protein